MQQPHRYRHLIFFVSLFLSYHQSPLHWKMINVFFFLSMKWKIWLEPITGDLSIVEIIRLSSDRNNQRCNAEATESSAPFPDQQTINSNLCFIWHRASSILGIKANILTTSPRLHVSKWERQNHIFLFRRWGFFAEFYCTITATRKKKICQRKKEKKNVKLLQVS